MAIRAAAVPATFSGNNAMRASSRSGWSTRYAPGLANDVFQDALQLQMWQPAKLSRPGNLGTAYTGVWTENLTSANDAHRPIPFQLFTAVGGNVIGAHLPFVQNINHRSPI